MAASEPEPWRRRITSGTGLHEEEGSMARFGRAQKASALLPLAVLSAAWTAGLATAGSDASAAADPQTLPDGTRVPAKAIHAPASLTAPRSLTHGLSGDAHQIVATASASGIPAVALSAYQRAATVINAADRTCHMPWQLIGAIGRVESDHGRADGSTLTDQGIATPGIYGPALDGTHGTVRIKDTDAGQYDQDSRFDRAVGPMQFIPSTWAIVGVDADNDGQRNPQDIYDAALGSAVYLCSGPDDLSTTAGQRAAVFRYNHSRAYVDLVLAIERAYLLGDYTSVPNGTTSTSFSLGTPPLVGHAVHHGRHTHPGGHHHHHHHQTTVTTSQPTSGPTTAPPAAPTDGTTANPTQDPTGGLPTLLPTKLPTTLPTSILPSVIPSLLTTAQATVKCLAQGLLVGTAAFNQCVHDLTTP
jgi:membrane-bound lytic murein transglycosylase B